MRRLVLLVLVPAAIHAQKTVVVQRPPAVPPPVRAVADSATQRSAPTGRSAQSAQLPGPRFHHLTLQSFLLSRFDDNVERDTIGRTSIGMITGLGAQFQSGPVRPWLTAEYDVAFHRYTATDRFNRMSQRARTTVGGRLTKWWTLEFVTEGSLKGSFEDRDVSDQLSLQPQAELKVGNARRIRFTASHRWRRYPETPDQDAINRYASAEFRHRMPDGATWESELRIEQNDAVVSRFDYRRTTWNSVYTTPLGSRATLELEMQYRLQAYLGRVVEIDDVDRPRRDHRLQPSAAFIYRLGSADLELSYEPEWRRSNDPTKNVDQNVLLVGVRHRWR